MKPTLVMLFALSLAATAKAHEGHGLPGVSHWHPSDVWPWLLALAVVLGIIWLRGRDR
jgi:hypothetical protein